MGKFQRIRLSIIYAARSLDLKMPQNLWSRHVLSTHLG